MLFVSIITYVLFRHEINLSDHSLLILISPLYLWQWIYYSASFIAFLVDTSMNGEKKWKRKKERVERIDYGTIIFLLVKDKEKYLLNDLRESSELQHVDI